MRLDLVAQLSPATPVAVPPLGFGGGALNAPRQRFDIDIARAAVVAAWRAGVRYFDTAPLYGYGMSESLIGEILCGHNETSIVSTKVGRSLVQGGPPMAGEPQIDGVSFGMVYDYSREGTIRGIEESLQRLRRPQIDIAFIHDIDATTHGAAQPFHFRNAMEGAYRGLQELKKSGMVGAIGLGVNDVATCVEAMQQAEFDCFLVAGRYTLLDQSILDDLVPLCRSKAIGLIIGGPYNSGILANPSPVATFDYGPVPEFIREKVRSLLRVCDRFGLPLPAAALQFPLGEPCVRSVIPGARTAAEALKNIDFLNVEIPGEFWSALKNEKLIRRDAQTPADRIKLT